MYIGAGYRFEEIGDVFEKLSELFQATGICHLLERSDAEAFRVNLIRSAQARRFYLKRARSAGSPDDRRLALSRSQAFLDAVVAGNLALAREIAELSPDTWLANREYEDDFHYFLFLHIIVKRPQDLPVPLLEGHLQKLEQALEGAASTRLAICRALLARDPRAFAEALGALVAERRENFDEERSRVAESDGLFWPRSFVFIEGLALLKLAEVLGMKVEEEFPMCPGFGRLPTNETSERDFFEDLDRAARKSGDDSPLS
jgi:hypothetical protein